MNITIKAEGWASWSLYDGDRYLGTFESLAEAKRQKEWMELKSKIIAELEKLKAVLQQAKSTDFCLL